MKMDERGREEEKKKKRERERERGRKRTGVPGDARRRQNGGVAGRTKGAVGLQICVILHYHHMYSVRSSI